MTSIIVMVCSCSMAFFLLELTPFSFITALDPSLMRHTNQEAVKRMRSVSNFGANPSSVVGPISTNMGDRSGAPRPHHCASFPPFKFSSTRFERSMSQDGSSIESLFTLPSERSHNLQIENSNSRIRNQMGGLLIGARVEGSASMNLVNFNGNRVKRSLSDNGIQIDGSSHLSPTQKSPNTNFLNPNLTKVRRSLSQEQNEIEGMYTLSSMDMLPVANPSKPDCSTVDKSPADMNSENTNTRCTGTNTNIDSSNPYMSRFRILSRSRSQMEGALIMSSMDKRLFLETALANATNTANTKANEIDKNKNEGIPSASSIERSTDGSAANRDTNKGGRIISQNENQINGIFSRSSAERSSETNSASCNGSEGDRALSKSRDQMESMVSLSSLERLPSMTSMNPNSNEENRRMLENQAEIDAALRLSSKISSGAKLASHEESTVGIELSLSSVERPHSTKGVAKSLLQSCEMEGILSLSSRDPPADASASKPDSRSEMARILTLASIDGLTDGELESPNTIREKCSSLNEVRIKANMSLTEVTCDTNSEKADANGAEKSLVLELGQMEEGSTTERSSTEMNSANPMLVDKDDDRTHSMEKKGQMESDLSISQMEKLPDSNPSTEHHGRRDGMQRSTSVERLSEANLREPNLSQMESTSVSSMEGLSNTALVQSDSNAQQHRENRLVCFIFYILKDDFISLEKFS
jgi:hypothetical protein